ncbi:MAG TPA: fibronectin type III domain-containing protein [Candidatus Bathyarchaeia archaeon]|nr:fibronectin type III domain-containing protein [Candidatus Bathyarchaeia archaeon]
MPSFPLVERQIVALAHTMHQGYLEHPSVFPGADATGLDAVLTAFNDVADDYNEKQALASIAAKEKKRQLNALKSFMQTQLKQSEADVGANPVRLGLIGWGPRGQGGDVAPPGQPLGLKLDIDQNGVVQLTWKKPSRHDGGRVRTYVIQRREVQEGAGFTPWHLAAFTFEKHIALPKEPRGQHLEYRVLAANPGGESLPSGSVTAML